MNNIPIYDAKSRTISGDGTPTHLTPTQGKLFEDLVRRKGRPAHHSSLSAIIDPSGRMQDAQASVKVHISRIRATLRESETPVTISKVWGFGYAIETPVGLKEDDGIVISPAGKSLLMRLISRCRDPELAEEATQRLLGS